jgi:hypothetical protein
MTIENDPLTSRRAVSIAFVRCADGATFLATAALTAAECKTLRGLLAGLRGLGLITVPLIGEHASGGTALAAVEAELKSWFPAFVLSAARAGVEHGAPAGALMEVWPLEPADPTGNLLVGTARLWGCDFAVEALRLESEEEPRPVPAVAARFYRWAHAAGGLDEPRIARVPRQTGDYAVFVAPLQQ